MFLLVFWIVSFFIYASFIWVQTKQLLPVLFYVDCYENVPTVLHLLDPVGNVFIVAVKHRRHRLLLHQGCNRIGEVYNLFDGGWISITSLRGSAYSMRVRDRMLNQVPYPSPARRYGLGEQGIPIVVHSDDDYAFAFVESIHFRRSCVKNLTTEDVDSTVLVSTHI